MWCISGVGPGAAYVLDPQAHDVDEAALPVVTALAGGLAGGLERGAYVGVRPRLVAEHGQRGVGEREARVELGGVAQLLLGTVLEAHDPLESGVVGGRSLAGRRQRQAQGVPRPGDRVPPADQPAVGEAPGERGHLIEHGPGDRGRLETDLRDRGGLPQLAAAQRAEGPQRGVGLAVGGDQPAVVGAYAEAGHVDRGERGAAALAQQVVEDGVAEQSEVGLRAGAVDDPADVAGAAVVELDAEAAGGQRLRAHDPAGADPQAALGPQRVEAASARGRHPVPARCSTGRRPRPGSAPCPRPTAAPTAPGTWNRSPSSAGAPVAGGGAHLGDVPLDRRADLVEARSPLGDVRDGGELELRGVHLRQPAVAGGRAPPGRDAVARVGQREDDVDHGQPGADQEHVGGSGAVAAYDVEGAARPRVGDEERGGGERVGRPGTARRRQAGGDHDGVGDDLAAGGGAQRDAGGGPPYPDDLLADRRRPISPKERVPGLLQRSRRGSAPHCRRGAKSYGEVLGVGVELLRVPLAPGGEVARLLGQRGHAGGRHVEQVLLVGVPKATPWARRSTGSTRTMSRPVLRRAAVRVRWMGDEGAGGTRPHHRDGRAAARGGGVLHS